MRAFFTAAMPASRPASAAASESRIFFTSSSVFFSRPAKNGSRLTSRVKPRDLSSSATSVGKVAGTATRRLAPFSCFGGVVRQRKDRIDIRLALGAIDLEIAHHDVLLAPMLEKNERVGGEKRRGIQHVGVALACGDNQKRILANIHGETAKLAISLWNIKDASVFMLTDGVCLLLLRAL